MFIEKPPLIDNVEFDTWLQKLVNYIELMLKGKRSEITAFTVDDPTPDVGDGNFFKTANDNATTITAFDGGSNGQSIYIVVDDANTTIDFTGTNLKGNGGVDWTPSANDHMTCIKDDTNWFCTISNN